MTPRIWGAPLSIQIVKQPSVSALASGFPRELRIFFSISLPGGSVFVSLPPKGRSPSSLPKREQSAVGRTRDACPLRRTGAGFAGRLALRRSTAAFSILGAPLAFGPEAFRLAGRRKERALGVIMRREAGPRTPGTTISESWAQAPLSIHAQFALQSAPLWMGMNPTYAKDGSQSMLKFLQKGVYTARTGPVVGARFERIVGICGL
jgi:hypothetical protein